MLSSLVCNHTRDETIWTPAMPSSDFVNYLYDTDQIELHSVILALLTVGDYCSCFAVP